MSEERSYHTRFIKLINVLALSERVRSLDGPKESEAERLTHALLDIEESVRTIVDSLLPQLEEATSEEQVNDLTWDICEEFRHVMYHLRDARTFGELGVFVE